MLSFTFISSFDSFFDQVVANYEAYVHALGIRTIDFFRFLSPTHKEESVSADCFSSSQILTVGSYDGKVRLLSMKSWQVTKIILFLSIFHFFSVTRLIVCILIVLNNLTYILK